MSKCVALLRMRFGRRDPSAPFALARRLYHAAAVRVTGATCTSHTAHRLSHDSVNLPFLRLFETRISSFAEPHPFPEPALLEKSGVDSSLGTCVMIV